MTTATIQVTLPDNLSPNNFLEALNMLGIVAKFDMNDTIEIDDNDIVSHEDALAILYPDKTADEVAGLHLSAAREKFGFTQAKLAELTDTQKEAISAMENGKRPISKKMAQKFAEVFKVDYRVFL